MRGKRVLITGASRGIGAAAARLFADRGARLGLMARRGDPLTALAADLGALVLVADVADAIAVTDAVTRMESELGGVDVLINNAAVIDPITMIENADPMAWSAAIDINLKGVFNGMRAVLPGMLAQGGGTIITLSSGAAHRAREGWSAYCASKAAAAMLTQSLHLETGARGIRAMGIAPGTVATDMQAAIRDSGINPVSQLDCSEHIPAEWAAQALWWMCGPEADPWLGAEISLRDPEIRRKVGVES